MIKRVLKQLARDEQGGEVMEYVLILGLIVVVAISLIAAFGNHVVARWNAVDEGM